MLNSSQRKTSVRLVHTIHQEIEIIKCRPQPRLETGDGSEPRRGLGAQTTSSEESQKGSSRKYKLGTLVQRQVQLPPRGKGGSRLLPPISWRETGTVKELHEGIQEKKSREDTAGRRWERKTYFGTSKPRKREFWSSEANSLAQRKPSSQKTRTWNNCIRKRKNSIKPTMEENRGCAKSGVCCGSKVSSIVGPIQEREGS